MPFAYSVPDPTTEQDHDRKQTGGIPVNLTTQEQAAAYDELAAKTIPDMEGFYGAVTDALPEDGGPILELACGTGILTTRIRKTHPDATLTCIDRSSEMLAIAREKPETTSATLIEGDVLDPWPDGPYDAIVSTFCIIAFAPDVQATVLRRIHTALRPGGVCITGCSVRPEDPAEEERLLDEWVAFMQDAGLDPAEILRQRASWTAAGDHIPTPDAFRALLTHAGFTRIRCPYHEGLYAVFVGER